MRDVGVAGAGVLRGVERLEREVFDERFGARGGDEWRGERGRDRGAGDGATTGYGRGGRGGPEEISTIDGHRSRGEFAGTLSPGPMLCQSGRAGIQDFLLLDASLLTHSNVSN